MSGVDLARPELWESLDCPLCGEPGDRAELVAAFALANYRRCHACRLVFLNPRLREDSMLELYRDSSYFVGSHDVGYERAEDDSEIQALTFRRRFAEIAAFASGARWLDVGCGLGFFVEAALAAGREARGLELGHQAAERVPALRDQIDVGTLAEVRYAEGAFDVVTLFDVIEHVYDLKSFVGELSRVLRPGGFLALATPNYDAWLRKLLGKRSVSFKVPEHVSYFTNETLSRLLAPAFAPVHHRWIGQYCSWPFLRERLSSAVPALAPVTGVLSRIPAVERSHLYIPSGSILTIFRRR